GLVVTRRSGDPGEERTNFQIRGVSSINNTPPLLVIDDIPFPDHQVLSTLNPNDIKQFSVLKDAAAASLYGARAAGGVILITTKNGATGAAKVSYQGKVSFEKLGMEFQPTTQADYYRMYDEGNVLDGLPNHRYKYGEQWFLNGNNGEATFPPNVPFFDALDFTYADRNFVEEMWKDVAVSQYHNVGITGGSDKNTYNITIGYLDRNGLQKPAENRYKRANVRFNYTINFTDKLDLSTSVYVERGIKDKSSLLDVVFAPNGNSTYWHTMPTLAQYNSQGQVYGYGGTTDPINELLYGGRSKNINTKLNTTLKLKYRITDNLSVVGLTGINYWNDFFESNTNIMTYYNWPGTIVNKNNPNRSQTTKAYSQTLFQNYSAYVNYDRQFGDGHNFTALAGTSYEKSELDSLSAWRRDLITEELQSLTLGSPDEQYNDSKATGWALA
ncbi:MAG: TonB-dependent receptor plug domain-containing protein, partial [Cytophagales bacterium]|nr:TonB-dependent receptor plug domain-containing protein [Cytophagales bacterium]